MSQSLTSVVSLYNSDKQIETIWSSIPSAETIKLEGQVNFVSRSSNNPYKLAVPNGRAPTCCDIKSNSKLLIAGEENGIVRVCTTDRTTAHLRKIQTSSGKITSCKFSLDESKIFTLGSESVVKKWEIATGSELYSYSLNRGIEPAQALATDSNSPDLLYAGDFSGKIHIIDFRMDVKENFPLLSVNEPVFCLARPKDSSNYLYATHGYNLTCFDLRASSQNALFSDRKHLKFISDISLSSNPDGSGEGIILTSGLDKMIKLTSMRDFSDIYQFKTRSPCLGVSSLDYCKRIFVGCENGEGLLWSLPDSNLNLPCDQIETCHDLEHELGNPGGIDPKLNELAELFSNEKGASYLMNKDQDAYLKTDEWFKKKSDAPTRIGPKNWGHSGNRAPFIHKSTEISRFEYSYILNNPKKLTKVDHLLRKFNHSDALFKSLRLSYKVPSKRQRLLLAGTQKYVTVKKPLVPDHIFAISVIRELVRRGTLTAAVVGRNPREISRILKFIADNSWQPDTLQPCMDLLEAILDSYHPSFLKNLEPFNRLCDIINLIERNNQNFDRIMCLLRNDCEFVRPTAAHIVQKVNNKKKDLNKKISSKKNSSELSKENTLLENLDPSVSSREVGNNENDSGSNQVSTEISKSIKSPQQQKQVSKTINKPSKRFLNESDNSESETEISKKAKINNGDGSLEDLKGENRGIDNDDESIFIESSQPPIVISTNSTAIKVEEAQVILSQEKNKLEMSPDTKFHNSSKSDDVMSPLIKSPNRKRKTIDEESPDIEQVKPSKKQTRKSTIATTTGVVVVADTPLKSPPLSSSDHLLLSPQKSSAINTRQLLKSSLSGSRSETTASTPARKKITPKMNESLDGIENLSRESSSATPSKSPKKLRSGKKLVASEQQTPEAQPKTPRKSVRHSQIEEHSETKFVCTVESADVSSSEIPKTPRKSVRHSQIEEQSEKKSVSTIESADVSSKIPKPKIRYDFTSVPDSPDLSQKESNNDDDSSVASKDSNLTPSRRRSARIASKKD